MAEDRSNSEGSKKEFEKEIEKRARKEAQQKGTSPSNKELDKNGKTLTESSNDKENEKKEREERDVHYRNEKPVLIKAEAYKTIILYASRYANKSIPPEEWKEIYGILLGHSDEDLVYVEKAEALTFGHATDVQLDERHYVFIDEIQRRLDEEGKGNYIVGWFHSHPGLGLFFSYIDIINQLGFQSKNPDFCGLVFDHTLLGKKKQEKVEGTSHSITKYETGFEIYRINDTEMDVNNPEFDTNYHEVDYVVDGLNKFFFANLLTELSALVTAGKPLQEAYKEENKKKSDSENQRSLRDSNPEGIDFSINKKELQEIPLNNDFSFDSEELFYGETQKKDATTKLKEEAEELIFEGNESFKSGDSFTGVEKYRKGIQKFKELDNYKRVLELLKNLTEYCLTNEHLNLAEEFSNEMNVIAKNRGILFYLAMSNYLEGYRLLKVGNLEDVERALTKIEQAAIEFEKEGDFAGSGMSFYEIGSIWHNRLDMYGRAALFYVEAIKNYNRAINESHPLRKSFWTKPEFLKKKIHQLRDLVEELIPTIQDKELHKKIVKDLRNIEFNF